MYTQNLILFLASSVLAVPLNINLGAYSPALVVGDGEISFGASPEAAKSAAALFETLATGAQAGSQPSNPQGQPATLTGTTPIPPAAPAPAPAQAQASAPAAAPETPAAAPPPTTAAAVVDGEATDDGAAIQNIAKKVLQPITRSSLTVRDIQGFRESLAFAKEAMKNTPALEIGTESVGVGIKQNPGVAVPAGSPAAGAPPRRAAKRDTETRGRTGITLLAIAEI